MFVTVAFEDFVYRLNNRLDRAARLIVDNSYSRFSGCRVGNHIQAVDDTSYFDFALRSILGVEYNVVVDIFF